MRRFMMGAAVAAFAAAACGDDSPGAADAAAPDVASPDATTYVGAATFEVEHYDFTLDLPTGRATAIVTLAITAPGDCVTIGFEPLAAESVRLDGAPAIGVQVPGDGTLTACESAARGWPLGAQVALEVVAVVPETTWGGSQVGYSTDLDLKGDPFTYLVSWVGGCDRHGPCDARPHLFPTYRFTVDHPDWTTVFCPGEITRTATRTTCEFAWQGGPTYSTFGLMAGSGWVETSLGTWAGGVTATLYDYPGTGIAAELDVDAISGHFGWLQETFGPYPYGDELRFVVGKTYWQGFEHPGNISLSQGLALSGSAYADGLTHVTLHEVTHQWAGDYTTLADTYDFVWKEAMAEYLTYVREDEQLADGIAEATAAAWKSWAWDSWYFLVPEEQPELLAYYGDVYGPGPMILFRQLEGMYGRPAILAALQMLIGSAGGPRAISVEDVRLALEAATGASLAGYFDAWVYGTGRPRWPRAAVTTTDLGGGSWEVGVDVTTQDAVPRGCAFTVRLLGAGGATFDIPVDLGVDATPFTPVVVNPGFAPTGSAVDPYAECLVWKFVGKPEPDEDHPGDRRAAEPWRAPELPR